MPELPAAFLEEGELQGSPLQHRQSRHSDGATGPALEAARQPHLLPVRVDLADVHRVEVPVQRAGTPAERGSASPSGPSRDTEPDRRPKIARLRGGGKEMYSKECFTGERTVPKQRNNEVPVNQDKHKTLKHFQLYSVRRN